MSPESSPESSPFMKPWGIKYFRGVQIFQRILGRGVQILRGSKYSVTVQIDLILRSSRESSKETFTRLADMVTPQAHKHHVTSRIRNFTIIPRICWTARFKICKDLYMPTRFMACCRPLVYGRTIATYLAWLYSSYTHDEIMHKNLFI